VILVKGGEWVEAAGAIVGGGVGGGVVGQVGEHAFHLGLFFDGGGGAHGGDAGF